MISCQRHNPVSLFPGKEHR